MVNSEQKGKEEKEVALDHAHVPTLVNTRIGGVFGWKYRGLTESYCG